MVDTNAQILEGERITSSIGMMVAIISFAMLFASLFLGFAVFRLNTPVWPPMGIKRPDLLIPSVSTILIVLSSFFLEKFSRSLERLPRKILFFVSLTLGILFIVSQFDLWNNLKSQGLLASSGIFGSLIYAFTWIHVAHMVLAVSFLLFLTPSILRGDYKNKNKLKILNATKFWHFLAIVWGLMFLFLFIF
jgi:cytochrome c oxidase subunit III